MSKAEKTIEELTSEAKTLLNSAFEDNESVKTLLNATLGYDETTDEKVDRAIDCIIMASALTVAKWELEARQE